MSYEHILYETDGPVATLTVNRPDKLNAISAQTVGEIGRAVDEAGADDAVQVLVITGAGEKAFISGADIAELATLDPHGAVAAARRGQAVFDRIENLGKPVIAAINGFALGGGCELAMACHIRIASDNAKIGLPEVSLGVIPGYGGTQRLPRLVGKGRALELILSARALKAEEAERIGLVNQVVPQPELMGAVRKLIKRILGNGPVAVRLALESVSRGLAMPLPEGLAFESNAFGLAAATEDMKEGLGAFLEKRRAEFKGK